MKRKTEGTKPHTLYTRWGRELDRACPLPEYPRPQLQRENWLCLNGPWEYAIRAADEGEPERYDGQIIVPFSPESPLSGVGRQLLPGQTLWYRRAVEMERTGPGQRLLLHFGAVDQRCTVSVNGKEAGSHAGGYWPFCLDITELVSGGGNTLTVAARDESDTGIEAYGKQALRRGGIRYTAQSGIWQTVWMETVPRQYIENIRITPLFGQAAVEFRVETAGEEGSAQGRIEVYEEERLAAAGDLVEGYLRLPLPGFRSWSPDDPFLYTVKATMGQDTVISYFGMREFGHVRDEKGRIRLALNGKPVFHTGLLDQGYWSDGLYTPPSDDAMAWEIAELKKLGFNILRKHIKIEPLRWYYHCDRLGMLVWQDFVSGGGPYRHMVTEWLPFINVRLSDGRYGLFGRSGGEGRAVFERDMERTVQLLYNAVGLAVWVPFNEGWGQFDACRIADAVRSLDPTRLIDHASGWHDQRCGDFMSRHIYYKRYRYKNDPAGRIPALTEFGGYSCPTAGHMASDTLFGYRMYQTPAELTAAFVKLYRDEVLPAVERGLSAAVYTQVSDVEDEINGVFTYDRAVQKLDAGAVQGINAKLRQALSLCCSPK